MPSAATNYWSNRRASAVYFDEDVRLSPYFLVPNQTIKAMTWLGIVSAANANAVFNLTPGGTVSSGSVTFNVFGALVTILAADTASQAAAKINAALVTQWGGNLNGVTVTGGPLTSAALVVTAVNAFGNAPQSITTVTNALGGSSPTITVSNPTPGVANGKLAVYASGNSDGTQIARVFTPYDVVVDPNGMVSPGTTVSTGSAYRQPVLDCVVAGGQWDTREFTNLDATALAQVGRLIDGTLASGLLEII